jgi:cellulose biosynthesis protein BcsQ
VGRADGTIITFYSYKGGTGRSMAVANTAWILASNGLRVLAVDWDLEAPGLHRYFHPFLPDKDLQLYRGIVDLVWDFAAAAIDTEAPSDPGWHEELAQISPYAMSLDYEFPDGGTVDFVPAGRQDSSYAALVTSFDWENFYERLGGGRFLEALKRNMRQRYDYVLVDSRTGLSDIAGICTVQLPDILVNCFSLSTQAIDGAAAVAASVGRQRRDEQVRIFPVPMRVEDGEQDKLDAARDYARSCFGKFLSHIADPDRYWGEVEVPYKSFYAYEEILAAIGDRPMQQNTILSATERVVGYLTDQRVTALEASPSDSERRALLARFQRSAPAVPDDDFRLAGVAPRVFIAYAYESAEHFEAVRELWFLLRTRGVDARMDLPPNQRPYNWSRWFLEQLRESDLVVVVASPIFKRFAQLGEASADDREPGAEVFLVRKGHDRSPECTLPVVLPGGSATDIPPFLADAEPVAVEDLSATGIESLLRRALWQRLTEDYYQGVESVSQSPYWQRVSQTVGPELLDKLNLLRRAVENQWTTELFVRRVDPQFPIIRWSAVRDRAMFREHSRLSARLAVQRQGTVDNLVDIVFSLSDEHLLVLGPPGAGKTTAMVRLVVELLADLENGPVPVLLSARSWRPEIEDLDGWLVRMLRQNYPQLAETKGPEGVAERLVAAGSIIPIVDGLDEMPELFRGLAFRLLSRYSKPVVTTCRTAEYREVMDAVGGARRPDIVVELQPLTVHDASGYLQQSMPSAERWDPVFAHLRENPDSTLGQALSTPVMLHLARQAYLDPDSDPTELLDPVRFRLRRDIGAHFMGFLTPAVYGTRPLAEARHDASSANRWLTFLAGWMEGRGTRDLAWWHLHSALSTGGRPVAGLIAVIHGSILLIALGALLDRMLKDVPYQIVWLIGGISLLAAGLSFSRPPPRPSHLPWMGDKRLSLQAWLLQRGRSRDLTRAPDPRSTLRDDRSATLLSGLVWATLVLIATLGFATVAEVSIALAVGCAVALSAAEMFFRLSTSAWGWYTLSRWWLAAQGKLPWRLTRFLDDAHGRGLLRQSGPVYQFRYPQLQEYLAGPDSN